MLFFRLKTLLPATVVFSAVMVFGAAKNVGNIASGVITSESDTALVLRTGPCDPDSPVLTFSSPWRKKSLGKKKCSDNVSHDIFEIEQLAPPIKKVPPAGDAVGNDPDHSQDQTTNDSRNPPDPANPGPAKDSSPKPRKE